MNRRFLQRFAVYTDPMFSALVKVGTKRSPVLLKVDDKAGHFHTAACTARAGSDTHQQDQNVFGQNRPQIKITY